MSRSPPASQPTCQQIWLHLPPLLQTSSSAYQQAVSISVVPCSSCTLRVLDWAAWVNQALEARLRRGFSCEDLTFLLLCVQGREGWNCKLHGWEIASGRAADINQS